MKEKNLFFRHLFCPKCAKDNIPNRSEAGITIHAILWQKNDDKNAYIHVTCMHCEAKPSAKPNTFTILNVREVVMPLISWNGLIAINPSDDGWRD